MDDSIQNAVAQWLAKANEDLVAIEILVDHYKCPRNTVCFHCQQHVEKLIKGLLTLHSIEFPKTHSLRRLIQLAEKISPELYGNIDEVDEITYHAVQSRYPDDWREVSEDEMTEVIRILRIIRELLLPILTADKGK